MYGTGLASSVTSVFIVSNFLVIFGCIRIGRVAVTSGIADNR